MSPDLPTQKEVNPILKRAVEKAAEHSKTTGKKISYAKLLPYVVKTLPLLVTHALAGERITYSQVSEQIGAGSPQNGNRAFKAIEFALRALAEDETFRGSRLIPDPASIVTRTGSSRSGAGAFWTAPDSVKNSSEKRDEWLEKNRSAVFVYKNWLLVLDALGLPKFPNLERNLDAGPSGTPQGESPLHIALKNFVAKNPGYVYPELSSRYEGTPEYLFRSGDRMDVSLITSQKWFGVEIKTSERDEKELEKGIFQILKYQALLEGTILMQGDTKAATCILALGGSLPAPLVELARRVGVHYVENLEAHLAFMDSVAPSRAENAVYACPVNSTSDPSRK